MCAPAGTHTWTGGSTSGLWSIAANWQNNDPPVSGESPLHLVFPTNAPRRMATNNIANVVIHSITLHDAPYTLAGVGAGTNVTVASSQGEFWWNLRVVSGASHAIHYSMDLALDGTLECHVATNASVTVRSALRPATPSSGLFKDGPGTLVLDPIQDNTFDGATVIKDGLLSLQGSHVNLGFNVGDVTVPGPLIIGTNSTSTQPLVRVGYHHQIGDDSAVTIQRNGKLIFAEANDTIGSLTLVGGSVETTNATLGLNGNVFAQNPSAAQTAHIKGRLSLGNMSRVFTVESNATLDINAVIVGGISGNVTAGLSKDGPGVMYFTSPSNTFGGLVEISAGTLGINGGKQLGATTNGTSVASNAFLWLFGPNSNPVVQDEPLSLAGGATLRALVDSTWNGPVQLDGPATIDVPVAAALLSIGGLISGPGGFAKTGAGDLQLNGSLANTYRGSTLVRNGDLFLANAPNVPAIPSFLKIGSSIIGSKRVVAQAAGQLASNIVVELDLNATLDVQNHQATVSRLHLDGGTAAGGALSCLTVNGPILCTNKSAVASIISANLQLGAAATNVYVGSGTLKIEGQLSGPAGATWFKTGNGDLSLKGDSDFDGIVCPVAGMVRADGAMPLTSWDVRPAGRMSGTGVVEVVSLAGGWLSLESKSDALRMSQLLCPTNGIVEVAVTGAASFGQGICATAPELGSNVITFPSFWLAYDPPIGQSFMFLRNDSGQPVSGTFIDRPEGILFESGAGRYLRLTYQGGDGNDIVLTRVAPPTPAHLLGVTKLQNGGMRVSATGTPGAWYAVWATEDLDQPGGGWNVIGQVLCPSHGNMTFDEDNDDEEIYPQRFYRFSVL